jgi:DNA-binding PadR family transcriptional regulator
MRLVRGSRAEAAALADKREEVLHAIDLLGQQRPTGPAIYRRMLDRPDPSTDQSLLYPALHSLEADWQIRADWVPDAGGVRHRTYRKRRLLPHHR